MQKQIEPYFFIRVVLGQSTLKNRIFICFFVFGLLFFSCSPLLKTISGIRDIRIETIADLRTFCVKEDIDLDEAFYYQAENLFEIPDSSQINFQFADEVLVFNAEGKRIIYKGKETGNYCSIPGSDFFSSLNSIFLPLDTVNSLNNILFNYRNIESDDLPKIDTADYYVVYFWAKWYKKLSKNSIKDIHQFLTNASNSIHIQSFYLNNDFVSVNYPEEVEFKKLKIDVSF